MFSTDPQTPSKVALSSNEHIILGDFNLHIGSDNVWAKNFISVLSDLDFGQHVCEPTHIHGHIIDVLCTSKSLSSSVSHHIGDGISDHFAVFFEAAFPVKTACNLKRMKVRRIKKINIADFMSDIMKSDLIKAPHKTASLLVHQYFHTLQYLLDTCTRVDNPST